MSDPDPEYVKIKPQLDCMRGIRNNLLHGELASPTEGHTKTCILTAQSMSRSYRLARIPINPICDSLELGLCKNSDLFEPSPSQEIVIEW